LRPSYRSLSLALLLGLGLAPFAAGCPAGVGATCQITSDCGGGLVCCNDGLPRGTCQMICPERADAAVDDTGVDAFSSPDAPSDTDGGS
jgi:hypothetical protein